MGFMFLLITNLCFFFCINAQAFFGSLDGRWQLSGGEVTYKVFHIMHNAEVTNRQLAGLVSCQKEKCLMDIQMPLKGFVSAEPKRDKDMLTITRAETFPEIKIKGELKKVDEEKAWIDLSVEMAGEKKAYTDIEVQFLKKWKEISTSGQFDILLNDFKLKAPELIGIPIKDKVKVSFKFVWKNPDQKLF